MLDQLIDFSVLSQKKINEYIRNLFTFKWKRYWKFFLNQKLIENIVNLEACLTEIGK